MSNNVGKELKEKAKGVNLIEYLFNHHPELIEEVGRDRFVHPQHDSLVIMERGFFRHSSPDCRGDQIQFLMDFLHLSFQDAVPRLPGLPFVQVLLPLSAWGPTRQPFSLESGGMGATFRGLSWPQFTHV